MSLDRKLTLTGTVGWEDVRDPGLSNQPKGITWSGGFTARPSPRSSLQFSYGKRNGDSSTYQRQCKSTHISSRTVRRRASFSESIQTSQSLIAQQLCDA